jgi:hypothetical protein
MCKALYPDLIFQRMRINLMEEEKAFVPFSYGKGENFHVSHLNFIKIQEHFFTSGLGKRRAKKNRK